MAAIKRIFPTGFAMIQGAVVNTLIDAVNNLTGNGTAGAVSATTLSATGAATLTGGAKFGGAQTEVLTTVAAAGATLGTATAIPVTANTVVVTVTASTEGVKLPTAATGRSIAILANPSVGNKVYGGAAGQLIGANTTATTAFVLAKNTVAVFTAVDATHWRTTKGA